MEHNGLPNILRAGDAPGARTTLDWMARMGHEKPDHKSAVGNLFVRSDDLDAAFEQYEHSVALRPTPAALTAIARILGRRSDWDGLIETWESYPADANFAPQLAGAAANAFYATGRLDEARALLDGALDHTQRSARDDSQFGDAAQVHNDLVTAVRYYNEALRLEPRRLATANNVAWVLSTAPETHVRRPREALRLAELVVTASAEPDANQLDTLGTALASAGRYDEAIAATDRALELARAKPDAELTSMLESRIELYRNRRPYRTPGG